MKSNNNRLLKLEKAVRGLQQQAEVKHTEGVLEGLGLNHDNPWIHPINFIPRQPSSTDVGSSLYRNGDMVKLTSIDINISLRSNYATNVSWRVMLLWEKKPAYPNTLGNSHPALSEILQTTSDPEVTVLSGRDWNNRARFHTIYDKVFTTHMENLTNTGPPVLGVNPSRKLIRIHLPVHKRVTFNQDYTAAAPASTFGNFFTENLLWMVVINDSTEDEFPPEFNIWSRAKYVDS